MTNVPQKNKYQAYAAANLTVAKTQQIIMLYDGVIRLVQQGKDAIVERRIEDRYNLLTKASNIIHGLQGCLDFENGGEIAKVLYSFYSTVDSKIFSIHRTNDLNACDEVLQDLKQMRDAWAAVDESVLADEAPHAVASDGSASGEDNAENHVQPKGSVPSVVLSA